jgi:hypothetical protein
MHWYQIVMRSYHVSYMIISLYVTNQVLHIYNIVIECENEWFRQILFEDTAGFS